MRLYLVRHGQTAWNAEMKAQGHVDIELDEMGHQQALALAQTLDHVKLDVVYCSDLKRAVETAQPLAKITQAQLVERPELRERSFGDWEGQSFDQIARHFRLAEGKGRAWHEVRPPNGESFIDVWKRIDPFIREMFQSRKQTAIVTHGGTCSLLLAKLLKGTVETSRGFRFKNTGLTELIRRPEGQFQLLRYNDTQHLEELEALSGAADGSR